MDTTVDVNCEWISPPPRPKSPLNVTNLHQIPHTHKYQSPKDARISYNKLTDSREIMNSHDFIVSFSSVLLHLLFKFRLSVWNHPSSVDIFKGGERKTRGLFNTNMKSAWTKPRENRASERYGFFHQVLWKYVVCFCVIKKSVELETFSPPDML